MERSSDRFGFDLIVDAVSQAIAGALEACHTTPRHAAVHDKFSPCPRIRRRDPARCSLVIRSGSRNYRWLISKNAFLRRLTAAERFRMTLLMAKNARQTQDSGEIFDPRSFGMRLEAARLLRGIPYAADIDRRLSLHKGTWTRYEAGDVGVKWYILVRYADLLDVSLDALCGRHDDFSRLRGVIAERVRDLDLASRPALRDDDDTPQPFDAGPAVVPKV